MVLVTSGGYYNSSNSVRLSSVSVWRPGQPRCSLPSLPVPRSHHTMDSVGGVLTVCGGQDRDDSEETASACLQLEGGVWRKVCSTQQRRSYHCSWLSARGLVLLGGVLSPNTTEVVLPSSLGSRLPGPGFPLAHDSMESCAIAVGGGLVLTGGGYPDPASSHVTLYTEAGAVTELPTLGTGRREHACGSLVMAGEEVRPGLLCIYLYCRVQVYIVAGGYGGGQVLASTELYQGGEWREGNPLPSPRNGARAGVLEGKLFLTGGWGSGDSAMDEVLRFHPDTEAWVTEGKLDIRMNFHAVTAIPLRDIDTYCTEE